MTAFTQERLAGCVWLPAGKSRKRVISDNLDDCTLPPISRGNNNALEAGLSHVTSNKLSRNKRQRAINIGFNNSLTRSTGSLSKLVAAAARSVKTANCHSAAVAMKMKSRSIINSFLFRRK
uniref:Uncharacterized protein n=1 Tax=Panagrellus redivivus TaxID=6233 RepID=A0A7E4VK29_PANRE